MRTVKIWLNHWFSSAYHIINMIKDDDDINFYVVGSNERNNTVYKLVCDEFYVEPIFDKENDYVDFCLDFCKQHDIEIFIPKRGLLSICKRISEFNDNGTQVFLDKDYNKVSKFNNKEKTYNFFTDEGIGYIPKKYIVNNVVDFEIAYKALKTEDNRVCIKFSSDEGAISFRVIDNSIEGLNGLRKQIGYKLTYANALRILSEKSTFPDLLVMPYLSGQEVSVDCLKTYYGNIIIPRFKTGIRAEEIKFDKEIFEICKCFCDKCGLELPFNIQFKYQDAIPYLLEVNTRMSGGIQLSCIGTNINIPNIAINKLLGINKEWTLPTNSCYVTHIETPVVLI